MMPIRRSAHHTVGGLGLRNSEAWEPETEVNSLIVRQTGTAAPEAFTRDPAAARTALREIGFPFGKQII
jgi:hypothetical protein